MTVEEQGIILLATERARLAMRITLDVPDGVAESLGQNHADVPRVLLESIAIEGCRSAH